MVIGDLPESATDLTIRSGPNFATALRYDSDLSRKTQSMFRVAGSLTLEGVDVQMLVPLNTGHSSWSMFDVSSTSAIELRNCTITLRNSDGDRRSHLSDVAVVRLGYTSSDIMLADDVEFERAMIDVSDTAVRCEATFVKSSTPIAVDLRWSNGLFLSTEQLVNLVSANSPMNDQLAITVELDYLTAIADGGLAVFRENNFGRQPSSVRMSIHDSIVRPRVWSSMVTHSGTGVTADLKQFLKFRGARNTYQDISTYWKAVAPKDSTQVTFADWVLLTGDGSEVRDLQWPLQVIDNLSVSQHSKRLYELDVSSNAFLEASGQVGFRRLREFPTDNPRRNRLIPDNLF